MSKQSPILQFAPFASAVDAAFWQELATRKLNVLKLSDEPQPLLAYYATGQPPRSETGKRLMRHVQFSPPYTFGVQGTLLNTNTLEEFKRPDTLKLFRRATEKLWQTIQTKEALEHPAMLSEFIMVAFADLKKYKFYYWFGFPALMPQPDPWHLTSQTLFRITDTYDSAEMESLAAAFEKAGRPPFFFIHDKTTVCSLARGPKDGMLVGFADPSSTEFPGWPLRNLLALLYHHYRIRKIQVLCYRETPGKGIADSRILNAELPSSSNPKSVGWERNGQQKLAPRVADLGPLMDPLRQVITAVDLNLKLMRWRVMPELDLEKIRNTRCLLLGAGTLGCYVARTLVGWGVRTITFVDNGRVSFSNPVRQPLYAFEDCLKGGALKAETAAKNLVQIQPTLNTVGHALSIPMPGHAHLTDKQLEEDIERLTDLFNKHDAVFLLTDSRESRWFPTLLGALANKPVINAALGFDTYLVMRHGSRRANLPKDRQLGCYFCNDIVAPADSISDRTLDQQCTVTRPGLAAIAGALAVELLVSILQHKDGLEAESDKDGMLGKMPHQIRGFLAQFHTMLIVGQAYEGCTACSEKVMKAYKEDPLKFMKKVLADPEHLEQVSGIAQLKQDSDAALLDQDWEEDEF
ncbi:E1-like protein-activating enzyme Gsa7p/Apg7p [Dichotomocladium elegans]|nr:E1-like protein-activating enzyme Gsa7p/Apg7p [Dichotomocladium elegans]